MTRTGSPLRRFTWQAWGMTGGASQLGVLPPSRKILSNPIQVSQTVALSPDWPGFFFGSPLPLGPGGQFRAMKEFHEKMSKAFSMATGVRSPKVTVGGTTEFNGMEGPAGGACAATAAFQFDFREATTEASRTVVRTIAPRRILRAETRFSIFVMGSSRIRSQPISDSPCADPIHGGSHSTGSFADCEKPRGH